MINLILDLCKLLKDNPSAVNMGLGVGVLIGCFLGIHIMYKVWSQYQPAKKSMNDMYKDGSDHDACEACGMCITCGDCATYGCGREEWQWPTTESQKL